MSTANPQPNSERTTPAPGSEPPAGWDRTTDDAVRDVLRAYWNLIHGDQGGTYLRRLARLYIELDGLNDHVNPHLEQH